MWSDPSPLCYTQSNCSQILHVRSIWNSFKIFTVSLSAEEIANGTLKPILSKFSALPLKPFRIPRYTYPLTHDLTRSPPLSTWVTHVARMRRVRGTFSNFLGRMVFHLSYKYPSPLPHFFYSARPLSSSSFSNPSAAATSSSQVRKSFTASTSSPPYSRRPQISSLRRRRSCLPPPS